VGYAAHPHDDQDRPKRDDLVQEVDQQAIDLKKGVKADRKLLHLHDAEAAINVLDASSSIPPVTDQATTPVRMKGKLSFRLPPKMDPNTRASENAVAKVELASQNGPRTVRR
jgi:hypothetical protein